jgi:hypothetical protein
MLRKRSIIETIIDQLKNISQIEHSRHRSPVRDLRKNKVPAILEYLGSADLPALTHW